MTECDGLSQCFVAAPAIKALASGRPELDLAALIMDDDIGEVQDLRHFGEVDLQDLLGHFLRLVQGSFPLFSSIRPDRSSQGGGARPHIVVQVGGNFP